MTAVIGSIDYDPSLEQPQWVLGMYTSVLSAYRLTNPEIVSVSGPVGSQNRCDKEKTHIITFMIIHNTTLT